MPLALPEVLRDPLTVADQGMNQRQTVDLFYIEKGWISAANSFRGPRPDSDETSGIWHAEQRAQIRVS
jgi:hypothetical protein